MENVDPRINALIDYMRKRGYQFDVTSGYRSPFQNRRAGGARRSTHMGGLAVDMALPNNNDPSQALKMIEDASKFGVQGVGVYRPGKLHFDYGNKRYWGPSYRADSLPSWASDTVKKHMAGSFGGGAAQPDVVNQARPQLQAQGPRIPLPQPKPPLPGPPSVQSAPPRLGPSQFAGIGSGGPQQPLQHLSPPPSLNMPNQFAGIGSGGPAPPPMPKAPPFRLPQPSMPSQFAGIASGGPAMPPPMPPPSIGGGAGSNMLASASPGAALGSGGGIGAGIGGLFSGLAGMAAGNAQAEAAAQQANAEAERKRLEYAMMNGWGEPL